jgi:hypothetical protein
MAGIRPGRSSRIRLSLRLRNRHTERTDVRHEIVTLLLFNLAVAAAREPRLNASST